MSCPRCEEREVRRSNQDCITPSNSKRLQRFYRPKRTVAVPVSRPVTVVSPCYSSRLSICPGRCDCSLKASTRALTSSIYSLACPIVRMFLTRDLKSSSAKGDRSRCSSRSLKKATCKNPRTRGLIGLRNSSSLRLGDNSSGGEVLRRSV